VSEPDCLFCKIVAGQLPADIVASNDEFMAFRDIAPQAPTHLLVIPRDHVASLDEAEDSAMLGRLLMYARDLAREEGIAESGFRTVINTNHDAQQSVPHIHVHIMGKRQFTWPPG